MSDTEQPAESASATPTPTPKPTPQKGKGRGRGRKSAAATKKATAAAIAAANAAAGKGRGRGRKSAAATKKATAAAIAAANAAAGPKRTIGGRRGRTKQFDDDKTQASYERQRELKAYYNELASVIKPALADLADRQIEAMKEDADYHKRVPEYHVLIKELNARLDAEVDKAARRRVISTNAELKFHEEKTQAYHSIFKNCLEDAEERFLDAQIRRLDVLEELWENGLPIDTPDEKYLYKQLTDKEIDEFGPYEVYHNGHLVPYPQLVEGTEAYYGRLAAWAPAPAVAEPEPEPFTKGKAPTKAQPKRRAKDQPVAPVKHTQSMLSAQPTVDADTSEQQSSESTPVPENANGTAPVAPKDREPALPAWVSPPDEYGCRQVNRVPTKQEIKDQKLINNRIIVPPSWELDPIEIGYRDSTNDPTRSATLAKRGKYYGHNDTNTWHYDPMLARHDARAAVEEDMDQEVVEKHKLHPRYGYFLPQSKNDAESPKTDEIRNKPVVYLTPSGKTLHASRAFQTISTELKNRDKELHRHCASVLAAVCERDGIDADQLETPETMDLKKIRAEMEAQREQMATTESAGQSEFEESARATPEPAQFIPDNASAANSKGLASLCEAALSTEEPKVAPTAPPEAAATRPIRRYDAIRDMLIEHAPAVQPPPQVPDTLALSALADLCAAVPPHQPVAAAAAAAPLAAPAMGRASKRSREDDMLETEAPPEKRHSLAHIMEDQPPPLHRTHDEAPSKLPGHLRQDPVSSVSLPPIEESSLRGSFHPGALQHDGPLLMETPSGAPSHGSGSYPFPGISTNHAMPSPYGTQSYSSSYANIAPSPTQPMGESPSMMPFTLQPFGGPNFDGKAGSAASTPNNAGRYRELAPAPLPAHRQGHGPSQELRTVQYVPGDNIKDYTPTEQPPARGPQTVRSWNQWQQKGRHSMPAQDRRGSN
ncbi:hypothetical protein HYQ45_011806 [Verticillium longisporum]|uniref:Uncharacterized protein n=1 Tax=Verticillium longisporum TaxID=100787 RepID=A0A8I3AMK8_VERLO|nr:hypothetical protein HYQ45_011806 [Verticillium longisporum]